MGPPVIGRGVELALRSVFAPGFMAARWLSPRRPADADVPRASRSPGLAVKIALDEMFLCMELFSARFVGPRARHRLRAETAAALALYERRGWLDEPASYHLEPPPIAMPAFRPARARRLRFVHVSFDSGYEPHAGEPGRDRWLGYAANRTAHAWVLEHPGAPRPWLVCVPGYRMGHPFIDFSGFPAAWLHRERGLNVVIPVLPLHGPRRFGRRSGDGFLTGDYVDTVHMQAQAIWDIRRVIAWLRARGGAPIGVYGVSLGGYTAALLASLENDLACVIAGMPATCYVDIARWNVPRFMFQRADRIGLDWTDVERLLRVISPLALPPRVPRERRYLFGGTADRLVPPHGVSALWRHWERPRVAWYSGTHISYNFERSVRSLLEEALGATGLVAN